MSIDENKTIVRRYFGWVDLGGCPPRPPVTDGRDGVKP
jgi:hypothetical protein